MKDKEDIQVQLWYSTSTNWTTACIGWGDKVFMRHNISRASVNRLNDYALKMFTKHNWRLLPFGARCIGWILYNV